MKIPGIRLKWEFVLYDGRTVAHEYLHKIAITREFAEDFIRAYNPRNFRRKLEEGAFIPLWFGFAYYDFARDIRWYMPIPFNIIIAFYRLVREVVKYRITHLLYSKSIDKKLQERIKEARISSYRSGYNDAIIIINADLKKLQPDRPIDFGYLRK